MPLPIITDRVYISGPMSSLPREQYIQRFRLAEQLLRERGYCNIVNPCRMWTCRWPWLYRLIGYRLTLLYDLWLVSRCQRIYKMPGWRTSPGSQMESCVAFHFGVFSLAKSVREKLDAAFTLEYSGS